MRRRTWPLATGTVLPTAACIRRTLGETISGSTSPSSEALPPAPAAALRQHSQHHSAEQGHEVSGRGSWQCACSPQVLRWGTRGSCLLVLAQHGGQEDRASAQRWRAGIARLRGRLPSGSRGPFLWGGRSDDTRPIARLTSLEWQFKATAGRNVRSRWRNSAASALRRRWRDTGLPAP